MPVKAISVIALSAVLMLGASAPAAARDKTVVVTASDSDNVIRHVQYRDLNLASVQGEKMLVKRVGHAVNGVCREAAGDHVGYFRESVACNSSSWQGAQPQIDQAVRRAREIAANGWSAIAPVAIRISVR